MRPPPTRDVALMVLVVVALALNVTGLGWGLPLRDYNGWDVDGIAPMGPLVAAKRMIVDEWWNSGYYNKYPMGHFFLLMAAYAPYLGYLWLTGGFKNPSDVYPFGFEDPERALTVLSLIARGVNVAMGVGIVVLVYVTARELIDRRAAFFAGLTVALSPAFIFYAHTGNVDTPSLFWSALALLAFGRLIAGRSGLGNYLLLGAAGGMAAATKEQTIGLFLLVPLSVVILRRPRHATLTRAVLDPTLLAGLAAAIVTFVVATHLVFNWDGNVLRFRWRLYGIHPIYGIHYPGGGLEVDGPLDAFGEVVAHTWDAMNPVLFLAGVAGLLVLPFRRHWARHWALPVLSYTAFAVALIPFFRARFVMEVVLALALFAGAVLAGLWTLGTRRYRTLATAVVLILGYSFLYGAEVDDLLVRDARYPAEAWLETQLPPGATVEAFSSEVYLPRFPRGLKVRHRPDVSRTELAGLAQRSPDFLVLSGAYYRRLEETSEEGQLVAGLIRGDFGYRPLRTFRRDPRLSPRLFAGLSPEILILARQP